MKIYTKTGDTGETGLFGGKRISKSDRRIHSYGSIDELNAWIGVLRSQSINNSREEELIEIQDRLFTIGSILATEPGNQKVKIPSLQKEDILFLEKKIDGMESKLPMMKTFVLPGGNISVSFGHVARTVCRRAERQVVALLTYELVETLVIQYLNRLSDYLFVLCRLMAQELNEKETPWKPRM